MNLLRKGKTGQRTKRTKPENEKVRSSGLPAIFQRYEQKHTRRLNHGAPHSEALLPPVRCVSHGKIMAVLLHISRDSEPCAARCHGSAPPLVPEAAPPLGRLKQTSSRSPPQASEGLRRPCPLK